MKTISENHCFGGTQSVYTHKSKVCACDMTFGLYMPPQAKVQEVPVVWYLSGLTCTHENAMNKAGAQRWASEHGLAVVFPDTSPRGDDVADNEAYDLGMGAGFYVNATESPWAPHYKMLSYVADELPALVFEEFSITEGVQAITGHSMGGHGALTLAMARPDQYVSASAFAPIANPTKSDWGKKQLSAYLGNDENNWLSHDATHMMREYGHPNHILVDQGTNDEFLDLLKPEALSEAMAKRRQQGTFRMQEGYNHSYFFVASFMEDHIAFHADALYGV